MIDKRDEHAQNLIEEFKILCENEANEDPNEIFSVFLFHKLARLELLIAQALGISEADYVKEAAKMNKEQRLLQKTSKN